MDEVSKKRGYSKSTLPEFTQAEIELVRGIANTIARVARVSNNIMKSAAESFYSSILKYFVGRMTSSETWLSVHLLCKMF